MEGVERARVWKIFAPTLSDGYSKTKCRATADQQGQGQGGDQRSGHRAGEGGMTREEAFRILGLLEGATKADIKKAHHKLMTANHPDLGGSDYLASKINQARDLLLGAE